MIMDSLTGRLIPAQVSIYKQLKLVLNNSKQEENNHVVH